MKMLMKRNFFDCYSKKKQMLDFFVVKNIVNDLFLFDFMLI